MNTSFRSLLSFVFASVLFGTAALHSVNAHETKRAREVKKNSIVETFLSQSTSEGGIWSSLLPPLSVFVVNIDTDQNDLLPGDGVCDDGGGDCSLRAAIQESNAFAGANSIDFSIGGGCPQTITPLTPLPAITDPVTINGYSQPGALPNTAATGSNAQLCIVLNGSSVGGFADGLQINAVNTTVRGLNIRNWTDAGIEVGTGNGSIIEGNFIGTDLSGTFPSANRHGVLVFASGVRVGGTTLISRNIVSGNTRFGVSLTEPASGNIVQNNYVGLGANSLEISNGETGVQMFRSGNNTIGGTAAGARNVISGNGLLATGGLDASGIYIFGTVALGQAPNNVIQGNYIGTDPTGSVAIPNRFNGVRIDGAINSTVGGTTAGARNVISGNGFDGVGMGGGATGNVVQGNYIGLSANGAADLGNAQNGVIVFDAGNTIGGTAAGARNYISGNNVRGVAIVGAGNLVQGNVIGTNTAGTAAIPNANIGIQVQSNSNTIGGTTVEARNYVAGNAFFGIGILFGTNNLVQGNYVGISTTGAAFSNGTGIFVDANNNTVGGTAAGAGNLISGNSSFGIRVVPLSSSSATGNTIQGNSIGTNAAGMAGVPNGSGIVLQFAHSSIVGGTTPEARNIISGNTNNGVDVLNSNNCLVQGNYIGTAIDGVTRLSNGGNGVAIQTSETAATANSNVIGGTAAGAGNLISGNNQAGVRISAIASTEADTNLIQGNTIGLDGAGDPEPNLVNGVTITGPTANTNIVGVNVVSQPTGGNIISGNTGHGVQIVMAGTNNGVFGNRIGTNAAGTHARPNTLNGILIDQTTFCRIGSPSPVFGNLVSGNTAGGIRITGAGVTATQNSVVANHLGSNAAGNNYLLTADGTAFASNGNYGIQIESPLNTIGGPTAASRNLISGQFISNHAGIRVLGGASSTVIRNNYIGVTANGSDFLFNGFNVEFFGTSNVTLDSNLISGAFLGVRFNAVNGGFVTNNVLGLNAAQTGVLGNGHALFLESGTTNVRIGEDSVGNSAPNVIAGNNFNGITINSNTANGNLIRQNSIYDNLRLGIDLGNDGVSQNDATDPDFGPNNFQNYPILNTVSTVIAGSFNSTPSRNFRLEFYSSPTSDPTGFGEGRTFVTSTNVSTDAGGNASFSIPNPQPLGTFISATATDLTTNDTSEFSGWKQTLAPTAVKFAGGEAKAFDNGVLLEWQTGLESRNLGFRIYREKNGKRELATKRLVAGSALTTGAQLLSGQNYSWFDIGGNENTAYFVEAVDLDGSVEVFGAIRSGGHCRCGKFKTDISPTLDQLGAADDSKQMTDQPGNSVQLSSKLAPAQIETQNKLAESASVKIKINRPGFYRIAAEQLFANGLPVGANTANLRLFADGIEQPINVLNENGFAGIEFYGTGTETTETRTRVYYLAASDSTGMRLKKFDETRPATGELSFRSTVQRRDRNIYFSALLNGDSENFFGPVVTNAGAEQNLTVLGLANTGESARLEVNLQGVTRSAHRIRVEFNGSTIGSVTFEEMEQGSAGFDLSASQLREGVNSVRIVADVPGDVSLVDFVRLTYPRKFVAADNALTLMATGEQQITIGGFSTPKIRVFDVTNADGPFELAATLFGQRESDTKQTGEPGDLENPDADQRGRQRNYSARFAAIGEGTRNLIAVSTAEQPVTIERNMPSNLRNKRNQADLLILTRGDLTASLEPLAALRRQQGLTVKIVDTADVYDEFSFGQKSSQAVKGFIRFAAEQWQRKPRFVLLAGDATYDPKGYVAAESADVVQTRLVDVESMETASDEWLVDLDDDGAGELAVGRLPALTPSDMESMVGKLLAYERQAPRNAVTLVADARDGFDFAAANAGVRDIFPSTMNFTNIVRDPDNTGAAKTALLEAINDGQTLVAYSGHGAAGLWRGNLLTGSDAKALQNSHKPVFVMMSCLNGYFINPGIQSLSEALLWNPDGGGVAVWASSATSMPDVQTELHRAFATALTNGDGTTLGDAVQTAKRGTADLTLRRSWTLFGDPSMRVR